MGERKGGKGRRGKDEIRIQESESRIQNERPEGKRKKAERRTDQNVGALLAAPN